MVATSRCDGGTISFAGDPDSCLTLFVIIIFLPKGLRAYPTMRSWRGTCRSTVAKSFECERLKHLRGGGVSDD